MQSYMAHLLAEYSMEEFPAIAEDNAKTHFQSIRDKCPETPDDPCWCGFDNESVESIDESIPLHIYNNCDYSRCSTISVGTSSTTSSSNSNSRWDSMPNSKIESGGLKIPPRPILEGEKDTQLLRPSRSSRRPSGESDRPKKESRPSRPSRIPSGESDRRDEVSRPSRPSRRPSGESDRPDEASRPSIPSRRPSGESYRADGESRPSRPSRIPSGQSDRPDEESRPSRPLRRPSGQSDRPDEGVKHSQNHSVQSTRQDEESKPSRPSRKPSGQSTRSDEHNFVMNNMKKSCSSQKQIVAICDQQVSLRDICRQRSNSYSSDEQLQRKKLGVKKPFHIRDILETAIIDHNLDERYHGRRIECLAQTSA